MQPRPRPTPFDLGAYTLLRVPADPIDVRIFSACPPELRGLGEGEVYEVQAWQDGERVGEERRALWFAKQQIACLAADSAPNASLLWGTGPTAEAALAQALRSAPIER